MRGMACHILHSQGAECRDIDCKKKNLKSQNKVGQVSLFISAETRESAHV